MSLMQHYDKVITRMQLDIFFNDQGIDNQHVNGGCGLYVPDALPDVLAFDCKNDPAPGALSPPLRAMGHLESHPNGGGQVAVAAPILEPGSRTGVSTDDIRCGDGIGAPGDPMFTLQAGRQHGVMVHWAQGGGDVEDGTAGALRAEGEHSYQFLRQEMGVRRLTPRECERLMGFPDDWTMIPWRGRQAAECPDGPRYRSIGNSMAVPVVMWIGAGIVECEERNGTYVR